MGAFDYIKFNKKLPHEHEGANDLVYQTKDLDCVGDILEVTEDGQLVRHRRGGTEKVNYTGPLEIRAYVDFLDARPKQPKKSIVFYCLVKDGEVLSIIKDGFSPNSAIHPHYLEIALVQWKELTSGFAD